MSQTVNHSLDEMGLIFKNQLRLTYVAALISSFVFGSLVKLLHLFSCKSKCYNVKLALYLLKSNISYQTNAIFFGGLWSR